MSPTLVKEKPYRLQISTILEKYCLLIFTNLPKLCFFFLTEMGGHFPIFLLLPNCDNRMSLTCSDRH